MIGLHSKFSSMGIEGVAELVDYYEQYDQEINLLRKKENFYCLAGCGACCYTPSEKIEVSVFEMIPLAINLALRDQGVELLNRLEVPAIEKEPCVLYQKKSDDGKMGLCTQHALRPLVCRIFGGSARLKKYGNRELVLCNLLKSEHKLNQDYLDQLSNEFPLVQEMVGYARNLNPDLSHKLYPINIALKKALEYVLLRMQWFNPDSPEPDEPPVLTPQGGMDQAA